MNFNDIRRKVIFEAFDNFPDHGNKTIAKYLYNKYPEYWASEEVVRTRVRYYRGVLGKQQLSQLKSKKYVREQI